MARRGRKSRLRRTLLLVAVQVVVTLLLLEAALRLTRPHHAGLSNLLYLPSVSTYLSRIDDTVDLVKMASPFLEPGELVVGFVLNSRGLRTHEYSDERTDGLRVVALGDSFTWGEVPFADTWPVRLQSELRKTMNRQDVEVISLALPGIGPKFYLRMWELEGRKLRPDLVVLGLFVGNDLTDHSKLRPKTSEHGWLVEHSLAVRAVRNLVRVTRSGAGTDGGESGKQDVPLASAGRVGYELPGYAASFDPMQEVFKETEFMRIEWERMAICLESNRPLVWELLRNVGTLLKELDRSVKDSGAELVVFLIPDEFQVDDELSTRLLHANETDPIEYIRNMPQKILMKYLGENGIHHIDGLPEFRSRSAAEKLYRPRNTHWNAAGNQLAAEMIVDYLQTSNLLP
jgi:hypothetical protein